MGVRAPLPAPTGPSRLTRGQRRALEVLVASGTGRAWTSNRSAAPSSPDHVAYVNALAAEALVEFGLAQAEGRLRHASGRPLIVRITVAGREALR